MSRSAGKPIGVHGNLKVIETQRNSFPSLSSAGAAKGMFIT